MKRILVLLVIAMSLLIGCGDELTKEEQVEKAVGVSNSKAVIEGNDITVVVVENKGSKLSYQDAIMQAMGRVFDKVEDIPKVRVGWAGTKIDAKGNESDELAMVIEMTRENYNSINWSNFDIRQIPKVADYYWEDKALDN